MATPSPLANLIGEWRGDTGVNLVMVPQTKGPNTQTFTLMVNKYSEILTFTEIENTANRGGTDQQFITGIRYDQEVRVISDDASNGKVIHVENGMLLYLEHIEPQPVGPVHQFDPPTSPGPFAPLTLPIVRQGSIPHGNTFAAPGGVLAVIPGPPTDFTAGSFGNILDAVLENQKGLFGYDENKPNLQETHDAGINTLKQGVQAVLNRGGKITNTSTLFLDTTQPNGGLFNVAFENRTTSSKFVPSRFQVLYWIEQIEEADGRQSWQLQYGQRTDFLFNQGKNFYQDEGLILWPHINANTLTKVPVAEKHHLEKRK